MPAASRPTTRLSSPVAALLVLTALVGPLAAPTTAHADDVARSKALYKKGDDVIGFLDQGHAGSRPRPRRPC